MEKKLYIIKDDLGIEEFNKWENACARLSPDTNPSNKGNWDEEKLKQMAKVFDKHYDEMETELRGLVDEDSGEALYEHYEDIMPGSMAYILIWYIRRIKPEWLDVTD